MHVPRKARRVVLIIGFTSEKTSRLPKPAAASNCYLRAGGSLFFYQTVAEPGISYNSDGGATNLVFGAGGACLRVPEGKPGAIFGLGLKCCVDRLRSQPKAAAGVEWRVSGIPRIRPLKWYYFLLTERLLLTQSGQMVC